MPRNYRHTKVVFTIGPATAPEAIFEQLLHKGVDVCRLNMAHASHEWTREVIGMIRRVCQRVGRHVAILMDVKGPEIRTGDVSETLELKEGQLFDLFVSADALQQSAEPGVLGVTINYPGIVNDVKAGDTLLVDSGLIRMEVMEVRSDRLRCRVIIGGPMGSRRHVNLPGVKVNLPCLTAKDRADIAVGIEERVDFFALSFVREADDLDILRRYLSERDSVARIVAKIEDQSAITNLDEIITACDGLMVARGDLGIEIPYEELPLVQRRAVETCLRMGKPVIIATHMLESMVQQPMPTRAEITDVANAVLEQADCVMLSGETTTGKYPVQCVDVLNRIIGNIEGVEGEPFNKRIKLKSPKALMLRSAVILSDEIENCAILTFTRSGYLAQVLSALRPRRSPIFAFTDIDHIFRQILLLWGVEPFHMEFDDSPEATVARAINMLKARNWVVPGYRLVAITTALADDRIVDTIQLRTVE